MEMFFRKRHNNSENITQRRQIQHDLNVLYANYGKWFARMNSEAWIAYGDFNGDPEENPTTRYKEAHQTLDALGDEIEVLARQLEDLGGWV